MNGRILELAKESGFTIKPFYVAEDNWQSPRFKDEKLEKFAELIVRECARISVEVDDTWTNQGEVSAQAFMKHFGVK